MASPHPEAELTFHGMWKKRLVRVFQNSIEPRKFPLTVGLSAMLQRSHTRRCGYNLNALPSKWHHLRFKGATPEGAVTTGGLENGFKWVYIASKEPHPKVRLQHNIYWSLCKESKSGASKEPHPKVRLQLSSRSAGENSTSLQRSHTRRCGYNR